RPEGEADLVNRRPGGCDLAREPRPLDPAGRLDVDANDARNPHLERVRRDEVARLARPEIDALDSELHGRRRLGRDPDPDVQPLLVALLASKRLDLLAEPRHLGGGGPPAFRNRLLDGSDPLARGGVRAQPLLDVRNASGEIDRAPGVVDAALAIGEL